MSRNILCPHCNVPALIVRNEREVQVGQRRLRIEDEWSECPQCKEAFYSAEQADARQRASINQARLEDGLLPPHKIRQIREGYCLTQRQFEEVLGVGEKTVVRWESGRVCQNQATDRLIRLVAASRENLKMLAALHGVPLEADDEVAAAIGGTPNVGTAHPARPRLMLSGTSEKSSRSDDPPPTRASLGAVETKPIHTTH
jgi:putative zinc finger/helix-turn-helix YgiT family protein